jgi:hypothetical protein
MQLAAAKFEELLHVNEAVECCSWKAAAATAAAAGGLLGERTGLNTATGGGYCSTLQCVDCSSVTAAAAGLLGEHTALNAATKGGCCTTLRTRLLAHSWGAAQQGQGSVHHKARLVPLLLLLLLLPAGRGCEALAGRAARSR